MRVDSVEVRRLRLPLITPFRGALGTETVREALLVHVTTAAGVEGWGECVAMAAPTYSSEYVDGAHHVLVHHLIPRLFPGDAGLAALAAVKGHPMAKAAVEGALVDADLRAEGRNLARHLGAATRPAVTVGVAVGITGSLDDLLATVAHHIAQGYRRVKLKIEPGWDLEPVRAVRAAFGPDLLLQVDANGAYTLDDAATLAGLDPCDLLFVEQPLPEDDLEGHAELARRMATPICLDESITSAAAAADALDRGACAVVNVKPGRVGGLAEARRIHDVCVGRGAPAWVGGMLETGVGRAVNLALAALPGFTLPGDISATDRYFARDVTAPFVLDAATGTIAVPTGPGIGVEVDPAALDDLTVAVDVVHRPA